MEPQAQKPDVTPDDVQIVVHEPSGQNSNTEVKIDSQILKANKGDTDQMVEVDLA